LRIDDATPPMEKDDPDEGKEQDKPATDHLKRIVEYVHDDRDLNGKNATIENDCGQRLSMFPTI
jgi:hypothetical protein